MSELKEAGNESSSSNDSERVSPARKRMKPEGLQPPPALEDWSEVTPDEEETVEEFVFRILGKKILKLAILSEAAVSTASSSRNMALSYRSVCRAWNDTVHKICCDICLPLFYNDFKLYFLHQAKPMLENAKSLSALISPRPYTSIELDAAVLVSIRKVDWMLSTLSLTLSQNNLEGIDCSSLNLRNLYYAEFHWFEPLTSSELKIIQDIIRVAPNLKTLVVECTAHNSICTNLPELALPKSLRKLQMQKVKLPTWLIDVAPTLINVKWLILLVAPGGVPGEEPVGQEEALLINKLGKSLESLKLKEILWQQPYQLDQPPSLSVLEPMPKLRTLKLVLSNRKVGELKNYEELLPSLTDLKVNGRWDQLHFPASWYSSPCFTLRRLSIHLIVYMFPVPPLPHQLLVGLSRNFPNLEELELTCDAFEGNNWQAVLCHGFPNLRKLSVQCEKVRSEGRNRLAAAISGIPLEELQAILRDPKGLMEIINKYQHCPSLRDLKNLQELKLRVSGFDVDEEGRHYGLATDSSLMIYSTFLEMPNLKLVELSRAFLLFGPAIQRARKTTGLVVESVRFARFELNLPYR